MNEEIAFLERQAARCRRLAREVNDPTTVELLTTLADDYDRRAAALGLADPVILPEPPPAAA